MLAVLEVANRLGRDPETIRRWIRSGKLRATKVGLQYFVAEDDLPGPPGRLPKGWRETATGEPMPDVVAALRRSRADR